MDASDFDPFSLEYTANPKPFFRECYRNHPVFWHEPTQVWYVHGNTEVKQVLADPEIGFDSSLIPGYEEASAQRMERWPFVEGARANSGFSDEEQHVKLRKLLAPDFKPSMVRKMASTVRDVVAKHCAPLQSANEIDIVKLVQEVPLTTIGRILGLDPDSEGSRIFLDAAPAFFRGSNPLSSDELRDQTEIAARRMFDVLSEVAEERKRRPQVDLISQTLEFAKEIGGFDDFQVVNALVILVAAGTDTTRLASTLATRTLIQNPEGRAALQADRSLLDASVLEFLRYDSPTKLLARISSKEFELGGHKIQRGAFIMLSPFAAGLDPSLYDDPDVFRPGREIKGSLSFGLGARYCLGVHLAKLQIREIVSFVLDHLPETATVDVDQMTWDPVNMFLREITSMPVQLR